MNGLVLDPYLFDCPRCGNPAHNGCRDEPNAMHTCEVHQERVNRAVKSIFDAVDALRGAPEPIEVYVVNTVEVCGNVNTHEPR